MGYEGGAVGAIAPARGDQVKISRSKNTKASAVMLSSLLELFTYGLLVAFNSPNIGDAILRGLNPFYELLLSIGL